MRRGNVLAVGTYRYVAVCTLQARSARRREALRRPQREERGGGILWRPPAYGLLYLHLTSDNEILIISKQVRKFIAHATAQVTRQPTQFKQMRNYRSTKLLDGNDRIRADNGSHFMTMTHVIHQFIDP